MRKRQSHCYVFVIEENRLGEEFIDSIHRNGVPVFPNITKSGS
jgi:hypothetical protein